MTDTNNSNAINYTTCSPMASALSRLTDGELGELAERHAGDNWPDYEIFRGEIIRRARLAGSRGPIRR